MSKYAFAKLLKLIRRYHNFQLNEKIKNKKTKKTKANIYKELLIEKNDTSQLILLKIVFFWICIGNIERFSTSSLPVGWGIKPGNHLSQLKVIYRIKGKSKSGNYAIAIPHYDGTKEPKLPEYKKGPVRTALVLTDGSSLIINASDKVEGQKTIAKLSKYISKKYITSDIRQTENQRVAKHDMVLVRADYYPNGQKDANPAWRHYFKSD